MSLVFDHRTTFVALLYLLTTIFYRGTDIAEKTVFVSSSVGYPDEHSDIIPFWLYANSSFIHRIEIHILYFLKDKLFQKIISILLFILGS